MATIAIVTGGGSGIGAAIGQALVRRGATVVLADVDAEAVGRQAERLSAAGPGTASAVIVDVRDADAVSALVNDTHRTNGRLDIMVNNAGIAIGGEPDELLLAHWNRMIDVNLRGVLHGCHAAYPLMKQQGHGQIINVASLAGLIPGAGQGAPYAMTKHGVVGLTLALRSAGADHGVRVSAVCPGFIDTPIFEHRCPTDLPTVPSAEAQPESRKMLQEAKIQLYPAERLAEDVLRGAARNKAIIIAPRSAYPYALLARFAPSLMMRQMLRMTRWYRRTVDQANTAT